MSKRTHYSDEQKAEALTALDANDGNVLKTARELGIGRSTLKNWAKRGVPEVVTQLNHEKRAPLADRLDALAHTLLNDMEMDDARVGPINQRAVALGIAIDKARLLRGESTEITEHRVDQTRDTLRERIERIATTQPQAQA